MRKQTQFTMSGRTLFYIKLKLIGATVFWCCLACLILLTRTEHQDVLFGPDGGIGPVFYVVGLAWLIGAGLALVRIPKEKTADPTPDEVTGGKEET